VAPDDQSRNDQKKWSRPFDQKKMGLWLSRMIMIIMVIMKITIIKIIKNV
jgi:hypothetical protein